MVARGDGVVNPLRHQQFLNISNEKLTHPFPYPKVTCGLGGEKETERRLISHFILSTNDSTSLVTMQLGASSRRLPFVSLTKTSFEALMRIIARLAKDKNCLVIPITCVRFPAFYFRNF